MNNLTQFHTALKDYIQKNNITVTTEDLGESTMVYYQIGGYLFEEIYYPEEDTRIDRIQVNLLNETEDWEQCFLLYPEDVTEDWLQLGGPEDISAEIFLTQMNAILGVR